MRCRGHVHKVWPVSRHPELPVKGAAYIARYRGKSIVVSRFVPGVKAVVPVLAGSMGMGLAYFTVINIVSGILWVGVQMVPAVALGRCLQVTSLADPRARVLAGLAAVGLLAAWFLTRLARRRIVPALEAGLERLVAWLASRSDHRVRRMGSWLRGETGLLGAVALVLTGTAALAGLSALAVGLLYGTELARSDATIAGFVQTLRTDWATRTMIGITMLGDAAVLVPAAALLAGLLVVYREWRAAIVFVAAGLAGAAMVPVLKMLLHRARPLAMQEGAQAFSFPSRHSTLAAIVYGLVTLCVARAVPERFRSTVYGGFAGLITLVALSRVYEQAHWSSDVVAGCCSEARSSSFPRLRCAAGRSAFRVWPMAPCWRSSPTEWHHCISQGASTPPVRSTMYSEGRSPSRRWTG